MIHKIDPRRVYFSLLVVGLLLTAVQIWSFTRTYENPPVIEPTKWDSEQTYQLVERACYDCHSNETKWPWYAKVWPMSAKVEYDVVEGRKVLNFSEWSGPYTQAEIDAMAEAVGKEQMPLPYYMVLHPEAQLTERERGDLTNGLIATMRGEGSLIIEP